MTWSAANEPTTASGSRRSMMAAARPIAGIESRGLGSATTSAGSRSGSWRPHRVGVQLPRDDDDPAAAERRQPVPGALEQGASGAGEVVEELRARSAGTAARAGYRPRPAGMTAQKPSMACGVASVMVRKGSDRQRRPPRKRDEWHTPCGPSRGVGAAAARQ